MQASQQCAWAFPADPSQGALAARQQQRQQQPSPPAELQTQPSRAVNTKAGNAQFKRQQSSQAAAQALPATRQAVPLRHMEQGAGPCSGRLGEDPPPPGQGSAALSTPLTAPFSEAPWVGVGAEGAGG